MRPHFEVENPPNPDYPPPLSVILGPIRKLSDRLRNRRLVALVDLSASCPDSLDLAFLDSGFSVSCHRETTRARARLVVFSARAVSLVGFPSLTVDGGNSLSAPL